MPDREQGAAKVAADVQREGVEVLPPAPVQLTLLDALEARRIRPVGTMGAIAPAPDDEQEGAAAPDSGGGRRGVGRPPGARNKSTEALRRYIFANFGNPLVNAARLASADPVELGRYLSCEPREAAALILMAVRIVSEYVNSKMPATVRLDGKGAVAFGIFGGPAPAEGDALSAQADPMAALLAFARGENVSDQGFSSEAPAVSNGDRSNVAPESDTKSDT